MTYIYAVKVERVIDGDTVQLLVDLGFHLTASMRFRILGVDTPERGQPGWAEATAFTRAWLEQSPGLTAATEKADSFGRWLADLHRPDGTCLSHALLAAGHAEVYTR